MLCSSAIRLIQRSDLIATATPHRSVLKLQTADFRLQIESHATHVRSRSARTSGCSSICALKSAICNFCCGADSTLPSEEREQEREEETEDDRRSERKVEREVAAFDSEVAGQPANRQTEHDQGAEPRNH